MLRVTTSTSIGSNVFSCLGDEPTFLKDFPEFTTSEYAKEKGIFEASIYLHDEIEYDAGFDIPILFGGQVNHPDEGKSQTVIYMNPHTGAERQTTLWWFNRPRQGYYGLICNDKPIMPKGWEI